MALIAQHPTVVAGSVPSAHTPQKTPGRVRAAVRQVQP
jgi:hypothetical protein